ncbi:MAG TPA: SPOR domain-containing protein [Steroidobacteraceae bacterium]|jgi:hypothetical protein|nr:SPOR domain-containing protein [Steroidobacteraceae bacterium]
MRAAFYALLLLNVAFFGWAHWIDPPAAPVPAAPARALPTLALVSSGAAGGADGASGAAPVGSAAPPVNQPALSNAPARATPAAANAKAAGAGVRCRSLGPFTSATLAAQMAARLKARGLAPADRSVAISINDGYTVYLSEPDGDADAQRRTLARLARAGIDDVHTMSGSQQQARISLGLFADQARAVRRAEQIRQLGFKPALDIHQSSVTTHWLDLQLEPNEPTPPLGQLLQELPGGAAAVTPMVAFSDCPTPTTGG